MHTRFNAALANVVLTMSSLLALAAPVAASQPEAATPKDVEVMVVGTYHMANPGQDLHNNHVDDVLAPKRQQELEAVTTALSRFAPSRVAVEWPADLTRERYARHRDGSLPPSRNEVVQLGFRLAAAANLDEVDGIDVDGAFPYPAVEAFAKAHGQMDRLQKAHGTIAAEVAGFQQVIDNGSVAQALRNLNDPRRIVDGHAFYRELLLIGAGTEQPGVDLLTAWYQRNFAICANLLQQARPGDRIVVFYGAGHSHLLRQCVAETPGYRLVEPDDYLP